MRTDLSLTALVAAMALAGCAVGPNYEAPDLAPPFAYHGGTALAARAGEAPSPALGSSTSTAARRQRAAARRQQKAASGGGV